MARPRKSPAEKLIPAKVTLPPERFDRLDRIARERGEPLAVILREFIDRGFREPKTRSVSTSC